MKGKITTNFLHRAKVAVVLSAILACSLSANAGAVVLQDRMDLDSREVPVHRWQDPMTATKGVVVMIHGFTMYGEAFDKLAKHLASQGLLVVAPDMRGFGEWYQRTRDSNESCPVDYDLSERDLLEVTKQLRAEYPELPVFVAGESLGASMAIRFAANHADMVSGLILSGPSVKYIPHPSFKMVRQLFGAAIKKGGKVDLTFYIKRYYSNDQRISNEGVTSPEMRRDVSIKDLLKTREIVRSTEECIKMIPASMPVLVLQGSSDQMVKAKGVRLLAESLKSKDKTVEWLEGCGHIVLETNYLRPDSVKIVSKWIDNHVSESTTPGVSVARHMPSEASAESGRSLSN